MKIIWSAIIYENKLTNSKHKILHEILGDSISDVTQKAKKLIAENKLDASFDVEDTTDKYSRFDEIESEDDDD